MRAALHLTARRGLGGLMTVLLTNGTVFVEEGLRRAAGLPGR